MRTASRWCSVKFRQSFRKADPLRYRLPMAEETKTIKITITPAARRPIDAQHSKGGGKLGRSFGYVAVLGAFAWLLWATFA